MKHLRAFIYILPRSGTTLVSFLSQSVRKEVLEMRWMDALDKKAKWTFKN